MGRAGIFARSLSQVSQIVREQLTMAAPNLNEVSTPSTSPSTLNSPVPPTYNTTNGNNNNKNTAISPTFTSPNAKTGLKQSASTINFITTTPAASQSPSPFMPRSLGLSRRGSVGQSQLSPQGYQPRRYSGFGLPPSSSGSSGSGSRTIAPAR